MAVGETVKTLIGYIKGPKGDTGNTGAQGPQGNPGVTSYATSEAAGLVRVGSDFDINSENGTLSMDTTGTEASGLAALVLDGTEAWKTMLGKIAKAISTVVTIAGDYLKSENIYNGLDQTSSGYVLDATQGKALNDKITTLCKYITYKYTYTVSANANLTISSTDFDVSVPSGYTACALSGFTTGSNSVVPRAVNTSSMTIKNLTASEVSAQATITVTYMLSGSISQISQNT